MTLGEAFWVFPDRQDSAGKPALYSVWISTHQDARAKQLADFELEHARDGSSAKQRFRLSDRVAYEVADRGRGCSRCADRYVFVQWDDETAIRFQLFTYRGEEFAARLDEFQVILRSLTAADRDEFAVHVRSFLISRREGQGAEPYLGEPALARYESRQSLYRSENCGDIEGYRVISLVHTSDLGTLYEIEAGEVEVLRLEQAADGASLIRDMTEFRACGTS